MNICIITNIPVIIPLQNFALLRELKTFLKTVKFNVSKIINLRWHFSYIFTSYMWLLIKFCFQISFSNQPCY
jgi:hypothetical protein